MKYRLLTVNREFGSGGGSIAQTIAENLDWKLLDKDIIDAIAYAAHVDPSVVQRYDEHVESWLRRLNQQTMRSAALAAGLELRDNAVFDAEEMVKISQKVIEQAYAEGNCVIVGRGSQCVLQHKPEAFHVFVYAPHKDRILRLRARLPKGADVEQRIRSVDQSAPLRFDGFLASRRGIDCASDPVRNVGLRIRKPCSLFPQELTSP
jgi:cytidylate kinase